MYKTSSLLVPADANPDGRPGANAVHGLLDEDVEDEDVEDEDVEDAL